MRTEGCSTSRLRPYIGCMSDPFSHARRRLARAIEHVRDFERKFDAYTRSTPPKLMQEIYTSGGRRLLFVGMASLPDGLEDSAVDAIAGFRATLDYAVYASCVALGATKPKKAHFPFGKTAQDVANTIKRQCRDVHPTIASLCENYEPFENGKGHTLWALNGLRNVAEHASIVEVRPHVSEGDFRIPSNVDPATVKILDFKWDHERRRIAMAEVGPEDPAIKYGFSCAMSVTFPDSSFVDASCGRVFEDLEQRVGGIVIAIEDATAKLRAT